MPSPNRSNPASAATSVSSPPTSRYPKPAHEIGSGCQVLAAGGGRTPTPVGLRSELPGVVIAVHGVNDVGTSFPAVEEGLCRGLSARMGWGPDVQPFRPASYSVPTAKDLAEVKPDPDALFYKRSMTNETNSMVVPFYWGFREASGSGRTAGENTHGQATDRYGNRLDLDFSKGGGPFVNATTTLADMWNRGAPGLGGFLDRHGGTALNSVLAGPGRMYFVLAAQRLAVLVAMIRDHDPDEAVTLLGHSQGCLISLLAQAFLMERPDCRPADTLILTHPPYSLEESAIERGLAFSAASTSPRIAGGIDARMVSHYGALEGQQTLAARLDTLINIVRGTGAGARRWSADEVSAMRGCGVSHTRWEPDADRDNRGKVYLYFCPEDMTVGLRSVQGIGWQGVPDAIGSATAGPRSDALKRELAGLRPDPVGVRAPVEELGPTFFQRVFTAKRRKLVGQREKAPFPVGAPPQDFLLNEAGEDDHGHTDAAGLIVAHLPAGGVGDGSIPAGYPATYARRGQRRITGEPLKKPVTADIYSGGIAADGLPGAVQIVDPIDAAQGAASAHGREERWLLIAHPGVRRELGPLDLPTPSPAPETFAGSVLPAPDHAAAAQALITALPNGAGRQVRATFECLGKPAGGWRLVPDGRYLVRYLESGDDVRWRLQQTTTPRSFHGAIIGSVRNHAEVTAYDVAIGRGKAVSDPAFYRYLCAVADWRLKKAFPGEQVRQGIRTWSDFTREFDPYWAREEDAWRRKIVERNCDYYSTGRLPACLPLVTAAPRAMVCETSAGRRLRPEDQEARRDR